MNFEELYNRYENGTATPEERAYVEQEIEKARKLSEILDRADAKRVISNADADADDVKRAKRRFSARALVAIIVISLVGLLVLSGAAVGTVFGVAAGSAKKAAQYDRDEATNLAVAYLSDYVDSTVDTRSVTEVDRDLSLGKKLTQSVYVYEITVHHGGFEYELEVDSSTGRVRIADIDD